MDLEVSGIGEEGITISRFGVPLLALLLNQYGDLDNSTALKINSGLY